jgi:ABC-type glutathione transport system ATPase component
MTSIVEMKDVRVRFKGERTVHALNGVDISLKQGEALGLLGESGSGKSVTLRALLRMLRRAAARCPARSASRVKMCSRSTREGWRRCVVAPSR